MGLVVKKARLGQDGDYNLSGERYRDNGVVSHKWPMVKLGDIFEEIKNGHNVSQLDFIGRYRVSRIQTIASGSINLENTKWTNDEVAESYFLEDGDILLSHINSIDHLAKTAIVQNLSEKVVHGINLLRLKPRKNLVLPKYAISILKSQLFLNKAKSFAQRAVNQASIRASDIKNIDIPLPPLEVQQEIVDEIEGYQKVIDGARQVVENYKPIIPIDPSWPLVKLGEVCEVNKYSIDPKVEYGEKEFIYIDISSVENGTGSISFDQKIVGNEAPSRAKRIAHQGDILLSTVRPNLKAFAYLSQIPKNIVISTGFAVLSAKDNIVAMYLYYLLFSDYLQNQMISRMGRGSYPSINQNDVKELIIPLAPKDIQNNIVAQFSQEQGLIDSTKSLIALFESKIAGCIQKVWKGE